jgi:8-oxo-dGTP diphosphatase
MDLNQEITCLDINGAEHKILADKLSFRPSAYGVVIKDGKILLSRQWDGYDIPGGGIEVGETIEEAVKREVKEETGIDVKVGEIISCQNSFFKLPYTAEEKAYVNSILAYYLCEVVGGELSADGFDEHEQEYADMPEWIDLDKLDEIKFYSSVDSRAIIRKAQQMLAK